jgi:hypothetical protein
MKFLSQNKDLNTYPIRIVALDATGAEQGRFTIKSVSAEPIPATFFAPPVGYQEITIPGLSLGTGLSPGLLGAAESGSTMEELQKLQQEITQSGKPPTPAQLQRLQELMGQVQGN